MCLLTIIFSPSVRSAQCDESYFTRITHGMNYTWMPNLGEISISHAKIVQIISVCNNQGSSR
jgi:hypothetical protein